MPVTTFSVYVFDFDGTLVQSTEAKRRAFVDIFLPVHTSAVEAVLSVHPDASRFVVIPMMVAEIERRELPAPTANITALIAAYGEQADARVATSPEMPGAGALLDRLSRAGAVYVGSMTPQERLVAHLKQRGWMKYLAGAFGYPHGKTETISLLLARHRIAPQQLLLVGDGVSDAEAAAANGCRFHRIVRPSDLLNLPAVGAVAHV